MSSTQAEPPLKQVRVQSMRCLPGCEAGCYACVPNEGMNP